MKLIRALVASIFLALTSCVDKAADTGAHPEQPELFGARFKEGKGVELSETMRKSLGVETVEVSEESIAAEHEVAFQVISSSPNARAIGVARGELAQVLKVGDPVRLDGGQARIKELTRSSLVEELEILATIKASEKHFTVGERITGTIRREEPQTVTAIPRAALLKTVEGEFVYTENGAHFLRTPVVTGRASNEMVEVKDGLYPGDYVVKAPVEMLWYAELQAIRGGQSCADEH